MPRWLLPVAAASVFLVPHSAKAERTELKTDLITQQTPVWCWAATASMALEMLGVPDINPGRNYQCGVVAAAFPKDCEDDCTRCVTSLGSMTSLVGVLQRYRKLSQREDRAALPYSPNYVENPQWRRIKHSLNLSYPIIAGISPDGRPSEAGASQHTVLITGYEDDYRGTGEKWVIIRDPYPYAGDGNPYADIGYPFDLASGTARLPWVVLRDRLNLTSAVFLETRTATSAANKLPA